MVRRSATSRMLSALLPLFVAVAVTALVRAPVGGQTPQQMIQRQQREQAYDSVKSLFDSRQAAWTQRNDELNDAMRERAVYESQGNTRALAAADSAIVDQGGAISGVERLLVAAEKALDQKRRELIDILNDVQRAKRDQLTKPTTTPAVGAQLRRDVAQIDEELADLQVQPERPPYSTRLVVREVDTNQDLIYKADLALRLISDGDGAIVRLKADRKALVEQRDRQRVRASAGGNLDTFDETKLPVGNAGRGTTGGAPGRAQPARSLDQLIGDYDALIKFMENRRAQLVVAERILRGGQ